jgi:hypothetical protein
MTRVVGSEEEGDDNDDDDDEVVVVDEDAGERMAYPKRSGNDADSR